MKQSTVKKYTEILAAAKTSGESLHTFCSKNGLSYRSICNTMCNLKKQSDSKNKEIFNLLKLYEEVTSKKSKETIETDDRAETSISRDENGKITSYNYQIFRRNKSPLIGSLSREEMNLIHRLYSYYGDSLTQRTISRYFVELSLIDFKRILRAFNITKASGPFASFMYEEYTEQELREIQLREKENSFLRKAEEDIIKNNEKLLKKYAQENIELRKKLEDSQFTVNLNNIKPYTTKVENNNGKKVINLYLSDMHIGASVVQGAIYHENLNYGIDEVIRRLSVIINKLSELDSFDKINLVLLGDNIDCAGFYGKTARLDHDMPENMTPREQANCFISVMQWFIRSLYSTFNKEIAVYSVPNGNHRI